MMKRRKINRSKSRKMFSRGADRTHKFNLQAPIMRGGIRM